jgi:hypothetical protein
MIGISFRIIFRLIWTQLCQCQAFVKCRLCQGTVVAFLFNYLILQKMLWGKDKRAEKEFAMRL